MTGVGTEPTFVGTPCRPAGPASRRTALRPERLRRILKVLFPTVRAGLLAFFVCVVAPFSLVALHIHENPLFSPIDEAAHFDYVSQIAHGTVPRIGDRMLPSTLRLVACTGSALATADQPPCDTAHLKPTQFGGGGYSYEADQPPGYYATTVPIRWLGVHVLGLDALSAARAGGALWLVAGLLLLWTAGRLLDLRPSVIGVAALLVAVSPMVIYEGSIVTNTAASVFAGCLVGLMAVLAWKRPGRWVPPVLFVTGVVVAMFKVTDVLAVVTVAALLGGAAWHRREADESLRTLVGRWASRWWRAGGMLLGGSATSLVGWAIASHELAIINPRTLPTFNPLRGYPVGVLLIAKEALVLLQPATGSYMAFRTTLKGTTAQSQLSSHLQGITSTVEEYLIIAGIFIGLFIARRTLYHWSGLISGAVLWVGGTLVGVLSWRTFNADPGLVARYGLALLPFLAVAFAASLRGRWALGGLWLFSVGTLGLSYFYMLAH